MIGSVRFTTIPSRLPTPYERLDSIVCLIADPTAQIQRVTASYQQGITNFGIAHLVSRLEILKELNLIYGKAANDE